jgi:hypothetical protein
MLLMFWGNCGGPDDVWFGGVEIGGVTHWIPMFAEF